LRSGVPVGIAERLDHLMDSYGISKRGHRGKKASKARPYDSRRASTAFARKLDLVAFLADALDEDLLTFFNSSRTSFHAAVGDFRDVQQTIGAGKDFNKGAEVDDS
jgi:hypothetical protein